LSGFVNPGGAALPRRRTSEEKKTWEVPEVESRNYLYRATFSPVTSWVIQGFQGFLAFGSK
jgi:hypothetical protein